MEVDILNWLNRARGKFACVATYEFDPIFFERRMLNTRAFEGADHIIVFVDDGRYRELLARGLNAASFDRRYFVVPISRRHGVFHPKLYLSLGDKSSVLLIGSNNCTASGTGHNLELVSGFLCSPDSPGDSLERTLLGAAFQLFRNFAQDAQAMARGLDERCFEPASLMFPWLQSLPDADDSPPPEIELLASHERSLWPQVVHRLRGQDVQRVTLLAPFFDPKLALLARLQSTWPSAKFEIVAQSRYSNLPADRLETVLGDGKFTLTAAEPPLGRRLHAKGIFFETAERTYGLVGSANASEAAVAGGNSEACLWLSFKGRPMEVISRDDLILTTIGPSDFVPELIDEPTSTATPDQVRLSSVLLHERKLHVRASTEGARSMRLMLTRANEQQPAFSLPVPTDVPEFQIELAPDQVAQFDRPVIGQLRGSLNDDLVWSSPVSVTQLDALLRDRSESGGAGNRVRSISETGEGLIEHLDSLGSVQEAIEFLRNVNIRFEDGAQSLRMGGTGWRPRDPFTSDFPTSWALVELTGSVTELRNAVWDFVQRHQRDRLMRHVRRGNLNGLHNFLDVFRTLNGMLFAFHNRKVSGDPVLPHPYVTQGIQGNVSALIGPLVMEAESHKGFIDAISRNLPTELPLLRDQLGHNKVAAHLIAAVEGMIAVRAAALKRPDTDEWSTSRRGWVNRWLAEWKLDVPAADELALAEVEYRVAA